MVERRIAWLVVGLLVVALALVAVGPLDDAAGKSRKPKITGTSHTHPEGEDFSYVCAKAQGKKGRKYKMTAEGPAVVDGDKTFKIGKSGRKLVAFEIEAAGTYTLTLMKGSKELDSESYDVPPPPPGGAAEGPFSCLGG